jgi:hypothetical protein
MATRHLPRVLGIEELETRLAPATFYVAPIGNDAHSGSIDTPWQTLQYAIDHVAAGDTILARAGTYHEALTFHRSGAAGMPITLGACPGEAVILSGSGLRESDAIDLGDHDFITIENVAIRDYRSLGGDGFGVWGDGGNDGLVLRGLEISHVTEVIKLQAGLSGSVSHDVLISGVNGHDYSLAGIDVGPVGTIDGLVVRDVTLIGPGTGNDTAVDGIAVESGQHVTVENAIVTGHPGDGIDLKADHVIVRRATATGQARNGIKIWGDDVLIENSIAMNNGLSSLVLKSNPGALRHFTLSHNLIGNSLDMDYPAVLGDYDNPTAPVQITANGNLWFETAGQTGQAPILIYITSGAQLAGDYNIYYSPNRSSDVIEWSGNCYSADDIQNGTWAAASKMDAHGLYADPLLDTDLRLLIGSPAIDRTPIGPADDRDGKARPVGSGYDVGPYERGTPGNLPPTLALANAATTLPENTDTTSRVKVAGIVITDDGVGASALSLSGDDAALFEIVGTVLYLKAGVALDYETNPVLDVIVAVDDPTVGSTPDDTQALTLTVTPAAPLWQNAHHPCDVTDDGYITPLDALVLINDTNAHGSRRLTPPPPPPFLDPNGDGWITPLDVLIVVNYVNIHGSGPIPSEPGGEGEYDSSTDRDAEAIVGSSHVVGSASDIGGSFVASTWPSRELRPVWPESWASPSRTVANVARPRMAPDTSLGHELEARVWEEAISAIADEVAQTWNSPLRA